MKLKFLIKRFHIKSNEKNGFDYRLFLYKDKEFNKKASFWHDINYLNDNGTYNMVIEVPQGNLKKLEMCKSETHNPIKQDSKTNKLTGQTYLRYYKLTPYFNYGFIPQTWENNKKLNFEKYYGDNDPIDVVEISEKRYHIGQIIKVKVLGSFCLIDEGEVDWKIIAIEENEKFEEDILTDNRVRKIMDWFMLYKTYDGKEENTIYLNKRFDAEETKQIIKETHEDYLKLIHSKL
jgi:inorganic pyrophosphatase